MLKIHTGKNTFCLIELPGILEKWHVLYNVRKLERQISRTLHLNQLYATYLDLGYLYKQAGQLEKAKQVYEYVITLIETNLGHEQPPFVSLPERKHGCVTNAGRSRFCLWRAYDALGKVYFQLKEYEKACCCWYRAMEIYSLFWNSLEELKATTVYRLIASNLDTLPLEERAKLLEESGLSKYFA